MFYSLYQTMGSSLWAVVSHFSSWNKTDGAGWMCSAKQSRRLVGDDSIVIVTLHRRQEMKGPATVLKWCALCCSSCGGGGYQTGNGSKVMVEFVRLLISYHQLCGRL